MQVQIISRESIKPSSPTPPHLRTFNFSFMDQIVPPIYVPILLFYPNNNGDNNKESLKIHCRRLKISLSETLTSFYPIAGRINGNSCIECNDEGVDYLEAQVSAQLLDVIKKPNVVDVLKLFLPPCDEPHFDYETGLGSKVVLAIQVNVFDCGGIVLSVCMSHKITDASSIANFIKCWASKARDSKEEIYPISDIMSHLFPQRDLGFLPSSSIYPGNIVTKRFVFDSSKIASLQAKSSDSTYVTHPTRVEAVSAFIWRRFIALAQAKYGFVKEYVALHAVNIRGRLVQVQPPLQVEDLKNNLVGNIFSSAITTSQKVEGKIESHVLVGKLRDAITRVDGKHVQRMQYGDEHLKTLMDRLQGVYTGEMRVVSFSSWCRFPFYEADFGWGKPIWVANSGFRYKDGITLMDTPSGNGIEAWMNMLEEDVAELEQDEEFLEFASLAPNA